MEDCNQKKATLPDQDESYRLFWNVKTPRCLDP